MKRELAGVRMRLESAIARLSDVASREGRLGNASGGEQICDILERDLAEALRTVEYLEALT